MILYAISTTVATDLKCRPRTIKYREGCLLKGLRIETETSTVTVVVPSRTLKALEIEGPTARFLPKKLFNSFENIEVLHVWNSYLQTINRATFSPIPRLVDVDFAGNELTDINVDTFNDLKNLTRIDLSHNKIKYINSRTFSENFALKILSLSFNRIEKIHENTFENLPNLEILYLSGNQIVSLVAKTFKSNLAIEQIDLSSNVLEFISDATFDPISTKLQKLHLESNTCITTNEKFLNSDRSLNFTKLRDELIEHCLPLPEVKCSKDLDAEREEKERLKFDHSIQLEKQNKTYEMSVSEISGKLKEKVKDLEKELSEKSSTLEVEKVKVSQLKDQKDELSARVTVCETERKNATDYLRLTVDKLINCDSSHTSMPSLSTMNEYKRQNAELRAENENIKRRSGMSDNHIYFEIVCDSSAADTCKSHGVVVPFDNMLLQGSKASRFADVKQLFISDSYMIFIPQDIFTKFRGLTHFEIVNGNVRNLKRGTFEGAGNLQQLTIYKNSIPILPSSAFDGAGNVQFLKLDSNGIETLSENVFAGLDKLSHLTLRNNKISEIPANSFSNLSALKYLHLRNNKIAHLRASLLSQIVNLEILAINGNPIQTIDANLLDNCSNLKEVYYGNTVCIRESVKATDIETFRNDVQVKCKV